MFDSCFLTSVHELNDVRIVRREALSLADAGYRVLVIGTDEHAHRRWAGPLTHPNIRFRTVRGASDPLQRWFGATWRVLHAAIGESARVYHFHDPELIPAGVVLRCLGRKVIYDVHEDTPAAMMAKQYIPRRLRNVVGSVVQGIEGFTAPFWSGVVTAGDPIAEFFRRANEQTVPVRNYPRLEDVPTAAAPHPDASRRLVVSFGGLSRHRVADGLVEAAHLIAHDTRIVIGGACESDQTRRALEELPGWERIEFLGMVDRPLMLSLLSEASVAVVLFSRAPNHMDVRSNRLFESMAAGLPVITSDFPAWREIVEGVGCGLCVPPDEPEALARAIEFLTSNPAEAHAMGERGRVAFHARFNWESQAAELVRLYRNVVGPPASDPCLLPHR